MRLLYNFFWIIALPFLSIGFLFNSRGRIRFNERFGIHRHDLRSIKIIAHGASVGEILSLLPILDSLGIEKDDILITGTSVTGLNEAQKRGYYKNLLLPFDIKFFYQRAFSQCAPCLCLISESDIWSEMIDYFFKRSNIISVNGRFRYSLIKYFSPLYRSSLRKISFFCVENENSKDSLIKLNVPAEKVRITGNAKYDVPSITSDILDRSSIVTAHESLVTLGSIRPDELPFFTEFLNSQGTFKVVIAPRHLELLEAYKNFLKPFGYGVWSKKDDAKILLLDTFGDLKKFYAVSDIIVVGGSFAAGFGGHNPLEGAPTKTATCIGEHAYKVQDIVDDLSKVGGIFVLPSDKYEIEKKLHGLMSDRNKRERLGESLHSYWVGISGSGEKQAKIIATYSKGGI